jgi:hypothetical protein
LDDDVGPHAGQFPAQGVNRSWSASVEVEHKHIVRVLEGAAKPLDLRGRPVRELGPQIPDLQIEAMALALARSTAWTHVINLSGQDFPVKPRGEIVAHLAVHASTHFVDWFDPFATRLWPNIDQRLGRWHLPWPYNSRNSNHFVSKTDGEIFQLGTEYSLPQASGLSWAEK